ncbi:hypothetical protein LSTR_LSTR015531 [Laodelphax striatellus]|uniref:Uncharacterized protein n=1 Tax=Laodelphax striatellus TaxID=195883 RepID=A0A482WQD2_LAOST|nr:hypothetical protein LSTR_LSTR015531 [Laodelphax striatellus]
MKKKRSRNSFFQKLMMTWQKYQILMDSDAEDDLPRTIPDVSSTSSFDKSDTSVASISNLDDIHHAQQCHCVNHLPTEKSLLADHKGTEEHSKSQPTSN